MYVTDLATSISFYEAYEFVVLRREPHFAELAWGSSRLYLEQIEGHQAPSSVTANLRVMVPDVDRFHGLAVAQGHTLIRELSDKYYGLRDFTVAGPDGIGLRFASPIPGVEPH